MLLNLFKTSRCTGNRYKIMSNYSIKPELNFNGNNLEICNREIIPINDLYLINKINLNNKNFNRYELFTEDEVQFNNIKSIFDEYINFDEYKIIKGKIIEIIEKGNKNGNVFSKNPLDNLPIDVISGIFVSPIMEYLDDNKIKDGIYFYNKIDNNDISDLLEYFKPEFSEYFISSLLISKIFNKNINGDVLFMAFKDTIKYVINGLYKKKIVHTYIMRDLTGYYKIGRSIDPIFRQYQLKTGNITIELCFFIEGDRELELHRIFNHKNVEREWYNLNNNDLKFIKNYNKIRKEHPEYVIYKNKK